MPVLLLLLLLLTAIPAEEASALAADCDRRAGEAVARGDWREAERLLHLALAAGELARDADLRRRLAEVQARLAAAGAADDDPRRVRAENLLAGVLDGAPLDGEAWAAFSLLQAADPLHPLLDQVLRCQRPSWADSSGEDRHGRWATLTVGRVRLRFRPVPPGRLTRTDGVVVACGRGFWIGETDLGPHEWRDLGATVGDGGIAPAALAGWIADLDARTPGRLRLPRSEEWEWAARAGCTGAVLPGGRPAESAAPPAAGSRPNAWGLADVHGRYWELCRDDDRLVRRGGGWRSRPAAARLDAAFPLVHDGPDPTLGCRLLIDEEERRP